MTVGNKKSMYWQLKSNRLIQQSKSQSVGSIFTIDAYNAIQHFVRFELLIQTSGKICDLASLIVGTLNMACAGSFEMSGSFLVTLDK